MISRLIKSADKWAPIVIALTSLVALVGYAWTNDQRTSQRIARLEGEVATYRRNEEELKQDLRETQQTLASIERWIIAVYERADAMGWKLPAPPAAISSKPSGTNDDADNGNDE